VSWLSDFRTLDRRVWALTAARTVVTIGYSMVMPFLAIHLNLERKVSAVAVSTLWLVAGLLSAASQWAAGELADRVGRRPLMLAAMFLRALNLAALGYAVSCTAPVVVIGALVAGNAMLRGFFEPVATALVADLAPPGQRVAAFALQRVGVNLGWAIGPMLQALPFSYAHLFLAAAPLTLLAALGVSSIRDPPGCTSPRAFTWNDLLGFTRDRRLLRYLAATLSFFILQVQLFQTTSIYAARTLHLGRAQVGTLYTLNGLLVVALQAPTVRLIHWLSVRRALVVGSLGYAAAYASVGLATGQATLLVCIAMVTLSEVVVSPAQQTAIAALAPPGRIGAYAGLYGLCQVLGQSTGPVVGAALLDTLPARAAWIVLAMFGIGAALLYRAVSPTVPVLPATSHKGLARG
jgi:MFS family permease